MPVPQNIADLISARSIDRAKLAEALEKAFAEAEALGRRLGRGDGLDIAERYLRASFHGQAADFVHSLPR